MTHNAPQRQHGATLIEVLIAVVVLSIGLLGLAGMQATSVKSNHSAYQRSQATLFAYDLADRMRANRDAALGNDYLMDYPASSSSHSVTGSQAAKDKAEWLNNLALQLPEGTGKVEKTGTLVTIHVRWNDNRGRIAKSDAEADANTVFTYRTEI
ncbi:MULTISPECIES: type IV pilus modification protein PilV [Pseudomonas]|uniref:Type IV pilus modification protein PilV n=1 Tax=Pseudomonas sediminis TaxID=1691904 RepID=A0ABX6SH66_9PSED|nr:MULTISPECIES: type IV pilus modification protein PilV [Pseudomonas]PKQ42851.1 type IV pilus modification protein PilV [Pseudomonas sp. YY-1]QNH00442.1 type IV pilus modification protein PilV [Pseudomonas sediminis]